MTSKNKIILAHNSVMDALETIQANNIYTLAPQVNIEFPRGIIRTHNLIESG